MIRKRKGKAVRKVAKQEEVAADLETRADHLVRLKKMMMATMASKLSKTRQELEDKLDRIEELQMAVILMKVSPLQEVAAEEEEVTEVPEVASLPTQAELDYQGMLKIERTDDNFLIKLPYSF